MLLEAAHADSEGYVEIVAGHFGDKGLEIDDTSWFQMPGDFERLEKHVKEFAKSDLYFTPSTFKHRKRTPDEAKTCRIAYVDADTCEPDNFRVTPTFTVETSPGKYQCFWLLDEDYPTEAVSEVVHRIAWAHREQGCDQSSWPANKIMRVPGSTHGKTGTPYTVTLTESTGELFSLAELSDHYGDVEAPDRQDVESVPMGDLPAAPEVAAKMPEELMDIFQRGAPDSADRSSVRYRFEIDLLKAGFTPEEVFVAVQRAGGGSLEKFTGQGRPEQLWHEILKAHGTIEMLTVEELEVAEDHSVPEISFLSPDERDWVEKNPTFIDEYVEWVRTRSPLSAETYQRSLAFLVLSCIYGNWGYVNPQFGKMKLNMWFIIAGDTTATRKSTARNLALNLIHHWESRAGKVIDIGSDATAEALVAKLAERDGQVSLLHRDEFQGFIREMFTKNYMAGMAERLTDLFDGKVMQVMRSSKGAGNDKRADTVFNMMMLGIAEKIADVLTTENFASGFLPRFCWSVADPPAWQPEHEDVGQIEDDDEVSGEDPQVVKFSNQFELARRAWNSTTPKRILADKETWARWVQWKKDAKRTIQGNHNEQIMEPSRDRMSYAILKGAALLAIHGRSDTIRMEHLLPVLAQSELWFHDMMRMANAISSSEFEGKVDRLEMLIAGSDNGTLRLSEVYKSREFKGLRKGEVDEHIRSLVAQGRAVEGTENGRKVLKVRKE